MQAKTSLIIPTLDRPDDLARCLHSITRLIEGFDEIIIVEQGDLKKTEAIIQQFNHLNIKLYFHSVASAAQARNKAIEKAQGEFIFFVDDDTELPPNYVQIALDYLYRHPKVMGITGFISVAVVKKNTLRQRLNCYLNKWMNIILLVDSIDMKVSRSGSNSHSIKPYQKITNIEWMQGANMVYRKAVFNHFLFNKNFILWSAGEDVMLSYQVYKHYGVGSLKYLPDFKVIHHETADVHSDKKMLVKMQIIYRFVFWQSCIYQAKLINLAAYLYGQIGYTKFLFSFYGKSTVTLKAVISAYWFLLKNHKMIGNDSIDYNAIITAKN